jgi:MinD-like ATPase involved in chromosome partitioning or flagellar assembly
VTTTVEEPQPKATPSQAQKKRLIISLGDKGGVGKSFLIRKIAELHMESSTPNLLLVDGDASVSSIFKFHQDKVVPFNLHGSVDARDMFVNDLLRRGSDLVIADMPAASLSTLREMATEYNFADEVVKAGYRMTVISPITQADYVAILNMIFSAERSDFVEWDAPGGFTKGLLNFVGGTEIEIPLLRPRVAAQLQLHRLSFRAGETSEHLAITDRGRLQRWNEAVDKALRGAGEKLGF